jgi:hypothetical protein
MPNRVKKWFMLQVWRLQQVAQILTLALLALNLALQIFGLIKWRENSLLSISYVGVPLILLGLAMVIWTIAIIWDLRLKMWREQQTVLMERNPYAKEKMPSKEVVIYELLWLPLLERMGKDDPEIRTAAANLHAWLTKLKHDDAQLAADVNEVYEYFKKK